MSAPQIPPRPSRSQQPQPTAPAGMDVPRIPPRPGGRAAEQSRSPGRDSFPRSPLNDVPLGMNLGNKSGSLYNHNLNESGSNLDLPRRPPSVSLPSIGQEGSEYADIDYSKAENSIPVQENGEKEPEQTRNVGSDLPLHAPRPSFSSSTAKARVSAVTRTDSNQAAAVGIGKASTPISGDDTNPHFRSLKTRTSSTSFNRTESSASTERPSSQAGDNDHGIPEIGQRVPMYPDAGDVQAPSPSPYSQTFPSGIGFHNDGRQKPGRHHDRTRSGKEVFHGPPGSYGLHGHGVPHTDRFEKAWYDKHPDALVREENGLYGPGLGGSRGEWALSSDDLNKIVRETASKGAGFGKSLTSYPRYSAYSHKFHAGTSPDVAGLPNEQIGYMASEEYVSRINTPQSASYQNKAHPNHSQTHVDSPLRKTSFPVDVEAKEGFEKSNQRHPFARPSSEHALESETEDDEIHIPPPTFRSDKIGGNGYNPPTEDLGPHGGNTEAEGGWIEETGYGVPILASDEVAKEPGSEYLQPAVSPVQERRGSNYYAGIDSDAPLSYQSGFRNGSRSGSASNSRPGSRPGSVHGSLPGLSRFTSHDDREDMHTPLEDVEEYEPLFPEEEDKEGRPIPATSNFKRRELMKRRFPSQDIWEDTPNSLQLQATVTTPEPRELQTPVAEAPSAVFETPETEAARKGEVGDDEKAKLIPREERLAKSNFKPRLLDQMQRPELSKQRFPSRDIWEDSPESARLETTVGAPPGDDLKSPVDEGLVAGAVVRTSGRPDEGKTFGDQAREGAMAGAAAIETPSIPPRPVKNNVPLDASKSGVQASPSIPSRPPKRLHQVPPAEIPPPPSKASAESSPISPESRKAPMLPERPKPQVPARPAKPVTRESSETIPLSQVTSTSSIGSGAGDDAQSVTSPPPASKPKPAVPARPAGSKIAALKAGFMSDLDKRLQLGPQAPSKPQEKAISEDELEGEKAPLVDARKGRARGPARRKPAVASAPVAEEQESKAGKAEWGISNLCTIWEINESGALTVWNAASNLPSTEVKTYDESAQLSHAPPAVSETEKVEDPVLQGQKEIEARAKEPLEASAPKSAQAHLPTAKEPGVVLEIATESAMSKELDPQASASAAAATQSVAEAMSPVGVNPITKDAKPENEIVQQLESPVETHRAEAGA